MIIITSKLCRTSHVFITSRFSAEVRIYKSCGTSEKSFELSIFSVQGPISSILSPDLQLAESLPHLQLAPPLQLPSIPKKWC